MVDPEEDPRVTRYREELLKCEWTPALPSPDPRRHPMPIEPIEPGHAPAGIVADPYVDNVWKALEREQDIIPERVEVFDGRELTREENDLFRAFAEQVRTELDRRACAIGFRVPRCDPENMGKGFRFYWTRSNGYSGHLDYHYDDMIRFMRAGESEKFGEPIGREMIAGILAALKEQVPE